MENPNILDNLMAENQYSDYMPDYGEFSPWPNPDNPESDNPEDYTI